MSSDPMTCRQFVELVTDLLEGTLEPADRERVEAHLSQCDGCTAYLAQMRAMLEVAGTLPGEQVTDATTERIVDRLRAWTAERRDR